MAAMGLPSVTFAAYCFGDLFIGQIGNDFFRHGWFKILHHQPINVPTAGAQAFFMDYT
jgi:hypothetical protein